MNACTRITVILIVESRYTIILFFKGLVYTKGGTSIRLGRDSTTPVDSYMENASVIKNSHHRQAIRSPTMTRLSWFKADSRCRLFVFLSFLHKLLYLRAFCQWLRRDFVTLWKKAPPFCAGPTQLVLSNPTSPIINTDYSSQKFQPKANEGRDGQTCLARPNSQAWTGTRNNQFSLFS